MKVRNIMWTGLSRAAYYVSRIKAKRSYIPTAKHCNLDKSGKLAQLPSIKSAMEVKSVSLAVSSRRLPAYGGRGGKFWRKSRHFALNYGAMPAPSKNVSEAYIYKSKTHRASLRRRYHRTGCNFKKPVGSTDMTSWCVTTRTFIGWLLTWLQIYYANTAFLLGFLTATSWNAVIIFLIKSIFFQNCTKRSSKIYILQNSPMKENVNYFK